MTQENSTDNTISDAAHVDAADGGAAVPSLTLAELNTFLGKDFKDTDTALKALKDTQSFVGKRKEDIATEVRAELEVNTSGNANASSGGSSNSALESTVRSLQNDLFFTQNPQYAEYRDVIAKMGGSPAEVTASAEFKKVFEKVQVADEVAKTKSVVSSNARLAQTKTTTESAVATANSRGTTMDDVATILAKGILESSAD